MARGTDGMMEWLMKAMTRVCYWLLAMQLQI
jgi:hypothetical protein